MFVGYVKSEKDIISKTPTPQYAARTTTKVNIPLF